MRQVRSYSHLSALKWHFDPSPLGASPQLTSHSLCWCFSNHKLSEELRKETHTEIIWTNHASPSISSSQSTQPRVLSHPQSPNDCSNSTFLEKLRACTAETAGLSKDLDRKILRYFQRYYYSVSWAPSFVIIDKIEFEQTQLGVQYDRESRDSTFKISTVDANGTHIYRPHPLLESSNVSRRRVSILPYNAPQTTSGRSNYFTTYFSWLKAVSFYDTAPFDPSI